MQKSFQSPILPLTQMFTTSRSEVFHCFANEPFEETEIPREKLLNGRSDIRKMYLQSSSCKIVQRTLSESIGVFSNPRWLNLCQFGNPRFPIIGNIVDDQSSENIIKRTYSDNQEQNPEELKKILLLLFEETANDTALTDFYLKPAFASSRGRQVIRVSRSSESLKLQSHSCRFLVEALSRTRNGILSTLDISLQNDSNHQTTTLMINADIKQQSEILSGLITLMKYPLLEETLPFASIGDIRVELRFLTAYSNELGRLEIIGDYAKCSASRVAANVSIAGFGMKTEETLAQLGFENPEEQAFYLRQSAEEFANAFRKSLLDRFAEMPDYLIPLAIKRGFTSLCVDIAPIVKTSSNDLHGEDATEIAWALIEAQKGFAYKGLAQINPDQSSIVKEKLRALRKVRVI